MVMSDRIALLRMGELEQVASPREIYSRPATAYTAQFIGHTNLLRGEVKDGVARCHSLSWPTGLPRRPGLFSLRPENIRLAEPAAAPAVRVSRQSSAAGLSRRDRITCRLNVPTAWCFRIRAASREAGTARWTWNSLPPMRSVRPRNGLRCGVAPCPQLDWTNVLPRLPSRDHCSAAALGGGVSAPPLRSSFLLQLLVGLAVADHRPFLDAGQLPRTASR